jgi:hypothetical protein
MWAIQAAQKKVILLVCMLEAMWETEFQADQKQVHLVAELVPSSVLEWVPLILLGAL